MLLLLQVQRSFPKIFLLKKASFQRLGFFAAYGKIINGRGICPTLKNMKQ